MNTVRYVLALMVLLGLPPGVLLWFAIHPFARHWRKLGPGWTYAVLIPPMLGMMAALFLARRRLLEVDFGTDVPLALLGVVCLAVAGAIAVKRRRHLTFDILSGVPELSRSGERGKLLTEGIYSKLRHPRYLEALVWTLGYALIANYLAPYLVVLLAVPVIYLLVLVEERELRDRFGAEYVEYCRRVPRFLPRLR